MNSKFYNKMPFDVKFRKIWDGNAPAVLVPGQPIEGPYEILSQYSFLAPIPFDFHRVETVTRTQGPDFVFKDEMLDDFNKSDKKVVVVETPPDTPQETVTKTQESPVDKTDSEIPLLENGLPFDASKEGFNWLAVKTEALIKAAEILKVDISSTEGLKPKDKKWKLVELVKPFIK